MKSSEYNEYLLNQVVENTGLSKKICFKYLEKTILISKKHLKNYMIKLKLEKLK